MPNSSNERSWENEYWPIREPRKGPLIENFLGKLASDSNAYHGGIFSAPCGTGKTVMTINMLSRIRKTAIILVHTGALVKQWREAIFGGAKAIRRNR